MKRRNLYISLFLISINIVFYNCSSTQPVAQKENGSKDSLLNQEENNKIALDHFISGGIYESEGNYEAAVKQYENALKFDSSAGIYYSLAKGYLYLNRLSAALSSAQQSLKLDSSQIEYYDLLANIYSYGNQNELAINTLEKALIIDSTNLDINFKLAKLYEQNKPNLSIKMYNKILSQIGPDWTVLRRVAELYERLGNNDEAIKTLEKLLSLDPANVPLKKMIIEFNVKAGHYDRGIELVDEIIELMPYDLEAREMKAQLLIAKNDWTGASKEFEYLINQPDVNLDAKISIGANYFNKSMTDSTFLPIAKAFFTKLDQDTTDWQIKMYLGAIALSEHNDPVAIQNFDYVTKNANWNVEAWIRLGGLYFDNKKYSESERVMEEAVISFPENFYVNLILGLAFAQQSKYIDSEKYLKKASILNPTDVTALSAYGYTLSQLKEDDKAVFYLKQALEIKPDDVQLIGTLAMIYNGMQSFELSDSLYERALELDPNDPLINNNYAYAFSTRKINLDRALSMIKISIAADSLNSSYLDTMGWIYFQMNNYTEAKRYIEKAIENGEKSAVVLDHLADAESKLGNNDKAIELWKEALKLDPTKIEIQNKIDKGEI